MIYGNNYYTPRDNTRWLLAVLIALVIVFGALCYFMPPDPSDGEDFEESTPGGYYIDSDDDDGTPWFRGRTTRINRPGNPATKSTSKPSPKTTPSPKSSPGRSSSGSTSRSR